MQCCLPYAIDASLSFWTQSRFTTRTRSSRDVHPKNSTSMVTTAPIFGRGEACAAPLSRTSLMKANRAFLNILCHIAAPRRFPPSGFAHLASQRNTPCALRIASIEDVEQWAMAFSPIVGARACRTCEYRFDLLEFSEPRAHVR